MSTPERGAAVITGASSGIGAATAIRLAAEGFDVVLGARRMDRLEKIAAECGGRAIELDVTDERSVERFSSQLETAQVLVNNAGRAVGLGPIAEMTDEQARTMWETNVLGVLHMVRALLDKLRASGSGHIVNVSSIAGFETYPGGGGYTSSKHALRAITRTLRLELVGEPIRITEISPGHVHTEFALTRFEGDEDKARRVYKGFEPLTPEDVADCIAWAVTRPTNVNIDEIVVRPLAQASATSIARRDDS
jgi:NADP-dependent 3-hydroxy acid dehydrogenase YdfG